MSHPDNLAQAVYRHACTTPDAPAVVFNDQSLSYRELAGRAAALAARLTGHPSWPVAGERPPRVGLLASRSLDACVALLGACWAGATYVPISLKQPEARMLAMLAQCDFAAVVTDAAGAALLSPSLLSACPSLVVSATQIAAAEVLTPPAPMRPGDIAYIIFTSGTTGVPKGVMIPLAAVRHYLATIVPWLGLCAADRALETCELSFDYSVHNMFSTWEAGASLHILPATRVMNAVKFARAAGLTVWNSVPSLAGMLRQVKALAPGCLESLRLTVFGGEQLPASTVDAWREAAPQGQIVNLYGPTEATVFCLAQRIDDPVPVAPGRDAVAIGMPLPGTTARIVNAAGDDVAPGTAGELLIGGAQLATGYLGQAELSAQRFPTMAEERWYRTGDLALQDAAGRFHCLGRLDNQVKVLGYRVELEEIDGHLRQVAGVDLVGTVAWPVVDGMARGVVGFVPQTELAAADIVAAMQTRVPPYMAPQRVIVLEQLPLNASGKVDRRALLLQLENTTAQSA